MSKLHFSSHVFDFALHPSAQIAAAGLITGDIECYKFGQKENQQQWSVKPTKKSCRGVEFSESGNHLYSISRDRSIHTLDVETGKLVHKHSAAHESPINKILRLNENLIATGDDMGIIKIWDNRSHGLIHDYHEHTDFIADMTFSTDKNTLIAVAGDGLLSIWDIRKPKLKAISDCMDDELLSVVTVKNEKKVITGSQAGVLNLWTWGEWQDSSDRIVGHPSSIDTICKLDEDTICTGSSDGIIRVVSVLPNKFEGVIGAHGEDFPIERIRLSYDNTWLASCAHDNSVRFWDIKFLFNNADEDENDDESGDGEEAVSSEDEHNEVKSEAGFSQSYKSDSDSGSEEDNYQFSDRDDSDEAERAPRRKRRMLQKADDNFFDGLETSPSKSKAITENTFDPIRFMSAVVAVH
ncbi:hypothetical protein INT44_002381 [Umbelopsis vinacea]|uniref:WD repeat-containing protein JIP5 n=1 Tax=Umbelopsis vinacea TaxID=44442 RepID=A0A8H7UMV7_9FUNG|nr:hypothetical protein INT44_002381 [Umbelopsis vinacea]